MNRDSQQPVPAGRERRAVVYSGHVQGVGFRATTLELARGYDVQGYVRNLPSGQVELVAEGRPEELQQFLAAIRRELAHRIRQADEVAEQATGEWADFRITY